MSTLGLDQLNRNIEAVIESAIKKGLAGLRVALPATVTKFDPQKQTVSVVPTLKELIQDGDELSFVELPEIQEVPICVPHNNNYCLTLPIQVGDECMLVFQDLCIDSWWAKGGIQDWNDYRRHDFSDAIAVFSPFSQANTIPSYNTTRAEFRNNEGSLKVGLDNDASMIYVDGNETHTGDMTRTGNTTMNGTLDVNGATTINNTETVVGPTSLNSTLNVAGATTMEGTLTVAGATTINAEVVVKGDISITGNTVQTGTVNTVGNTNSTTYSTGGLPGITGTFFNTEDGAVVQTLVITNGLITAIR